MSKQDDELLKTARKRFDACVEAETANRERAKEDLKFAYGEQWPDEARKVREAEQRPCMTVNKIPKFTRQVINDIRQVRPAMKVRPVDSQADPKTAEVMNGMIRAIEQSSEAESAYDWSVQYAVDMGFGYYQVGVEYEDERSFDQVLVIERIQNPFSVYLDPNTTKQDRSDMQYAFVIDHLTQDDFENKYPGAEGEWDAEPSEGHTNQWFTKEKIRVAEYWVRNVTRTEIHQMMDGSVVEGELTADIQPFVLRSRKLDREKVMHYIITGKEILEKTEWLGKYIPIVMVPGEEVNIEGETVYRGMVHDMKDSQRSYNYGRSAAAEDVALRTKARVMGPTGTFKDRKWNNLNKRNYPYIEFSGNQPPLAIPQNSPDPKLIQEMLNSTEEMKEITGIYDPSLGDRSNEVSGTAINARKVQSQISNFHFVDNLGKALKYTGRILVDLIPKIYDAERIVQILQPDGQEKAVTINGAGIDPDTQQMYNHNLAAGRYDVAVDIGPSYATQRQEAVETMLEMLRAFPQAAQIMGDLIAKNMDWPESDELAKRLRLLLPVDVAKEENPMVKQLVSQYETVIGQGKQHIQYLESQIQQLVLQVQDKNRELTVKEREQARKETETLHDMQTDRTEQELKYGANIPGAVI